MIEYRAKQEGDCSYALPASESDSLEFSPTRPSPAAGQAHHERAAAGQARSHHLRSSWGNQQHQQVDYETVRRWRDRWHAAESRLQAIEAAGKPKLLSQAIEVLLTDERRPGAPATFTFEQFMQIMALACEKPEAADRPVSAWTPRELADEAVKRGIVGKISSRTVERFLKGERFTAPSETVLAHAAPRRSSRIS